MTAPTARPDRPPPATPDSGPRERAPSADADAGATLPSLGTAGLLSTLSALLISVVSFAATGIALPDIGASLHATAAAQALVMSTYSIGFAVPMVIGGRLGDLYGRRRLLLAGMAGFALFSLLSAAAPTVEVLIVARTLTGVSAAAMVPQVLATITSSTRGRERARAVAMFGATAGGATAVGQVLGGVLLSVPLLGAPWRMVFAISVLLGLVAWPAARRWMPETSAPGRASLDLVGTFLLGLALLALLLPLSQGGALGWPFWCWASLAATAPLTAAFWWWQLRLHRGDRVPLVPPPLLRLRSYRTGLVMALLLQAGFGAFTFVYALTTQTGLGWSPMHAALVLLPFAVCFLAVSIWSGKLAPRFGFRRLLAIGGGVHALLLAVTAGAVLSAGGDLGSGVLGGLLVGVGVGQALMLGPLVGAMLADVPLPSAGAASGVLTTVQQAAMGVGVAAFGGVLGSVVANDPTPSAELYTTALAACLLIQALFALAFVLGTRALPRR